MVPTSHAMSEKSFQEMDIADWYSILELAPINEKLDLSFSGSFETLVADERGVPAEYPADPNIVDWDGPDDPENPLNWTNKKKWTNGILLSIMTLVTPLASVMFAPGLGQVLEEFHSTSTLLGSWSVSVYILGYAAGPLISAPFSEMYGRLPVYHISNILFVIFTIACALSSSLNMLIGFRLLVGIAGSTCITIGGGTFGDMFNEKERGPALSLWAMGPLLGPVIGPVAGGFLCEAKGWRWVFWILAIVGGALTILMILLMRETYPIRILEMKCKRLRKQTGNMMLRSKLDRGLPPRQYFLRSITLPLRMLIFSPIVILFSLYMAVVYGYLYLLFTTISAVFEGNYGFSSGVVSLTYLGIGIGMILGLFSFGILSKITVQRMEAVKGVLTPEQRLPMMIPGSLFIPAGLFIYGWTAEYRVAWIVPVIGTSMIGFGLITTFMPISTYLIDAFSIYSASAIAANLVLRSILGALLPLAGPSMYTSLGLGWGNSLLAFIALAMCPLPIIFWKYGERIRTNPRFQVDV